MNHDEAERILAALKSGQPLISRHKSAEALEWAMGPRWISVEKRLPDTCIDVLLWADHGVHVGYLSEIGYWFSSANHNYAFYNVPHWQPLPAGPGARDAKGDGTVILDRYIKGTMTNIRGVRDE